MPRSVKKMKKNQRKRKGKHPIRKRAYFCTECGYKSNRRFNVERHSIRIHSNSITKKCCGTLFLKKSDLYQHIEDCHPNLRSTCFVSKQKYKIFAREMKPSNDSCHAKNIINPVNSSNISDESEIIRRSKRIQKRTMRKEKSTLKKTPTESESDESDHRSMVTNDHHNDHDSVGEITHSLDNNNQINNLTLVSKENKNKYEYIKTVAQLPLKKRILCDINSNILRQDPNEVKTEQVSFSDKENQNPVDIFLNRYQSETIVNQLLSVEQTIQIWNDITQRQRDYLSFIDFNLF